MANQIFQMKGKLLMRIAKEDLLYTRSLLAIKGIEVTPQELLEILQEIRPVEVVDEPGLVSSIKELDIEWKNPESEE